MWFCYKHVLLYHDKSLNKYKHAATRRGCIIARLIIPLFLDMVSIMHILHVEHFSFDCYYFLFHFQTWTRDNVAARDISG